MTRRDIPASADELRSIADQVATIIGALQPDTGYMEGDDWRWGVSVEVYYEDESVAGVVAPHGDGWFGFYPNSIPRQV